MNKVTRVLLNILYSLIGFVLIAAFAYFLLTPGIPQTQIAEDGSKVSYLQLPNGQYTGEAVLSFLHGEGTFTFHTGEIYTGSFVKHQMSGTGTLTGTHGTYEGEFANSCRSGSGTFTWSDGAAYTGEWLADKLHGKGELTTASGLSYKGTFQENQFFSGTVSGTVDTADFSVTVKDGIPENRISVTFDDGVTYNGQYDGRAFSGEGTMTFPKVGTYTGSFLNNKRSGHGTFTWSSGNVKYVGNWSEDVYNGSGNYYFNSTTRISGDFDHGKLNGTYRYYNSDGTFITKWTNGKCTSITLN